ncbi:helix-turn-helix domain containing protein [Leuconostocaceae bacterium ESL0723]|nr:helix-turn-helix domain containing protein [Leuconostocaceae bacterium ESL0723]
MDSISEEFIIWTEQGAKEMAPAQKKVLQAAIELFAQQGFDATSTKAIAEQAGVSQAIIFKYYKSKAALLDKILDLVVENILPSYSQEMLAVVKDKADQNGFADFIRYIIGNRFDFMVANRSFFTIFFSQVLTNDTFVAKLKDELSQRFEAIATELEQAAGDQLLISGSALIRLMGSQLLVLFLETQRFEPNLDVRASGELDCVEDMVVRAALGNAVVSQD